MKATSKNAHSCSVAVIIPTFRRWPYMMDTVRMLLAQTRIPEQIVIIDQTPPPEIQPEESIALGALMKVAPQILYLRHESPRVYEARNIAASAARCDCLLFLDDDVVFGADFVSNYLIALNDPPVDAVVGYHESPERYGHYRDPLPPGLPIEDIAFSFSPAIAQRVEGIAYTCAGGLCIRSKVFDAVGGWDENVITYGDKDLGIRLFKKGYVIAYDPRPMMKHLSAPVGGTRLTDRRSPWSSWERCVSRFYIASRHLKGWRYWKYGALPAARATFLLRRNALDPRCWLPEFYGWCKAMYIARLWAKRGPKLRVFRRDLCQPRSGN